MKEEIGIFNGKKYMEVEFESTDEKDVACNHCAFELGKCRGAIWVLGQCYIKEGETIVKNIYYKEVNN